MECDLEDIYEDEQDHPPRCMHMSNCPSIVTRSMETLSQLQYILTYFHYSCPVPHILCIQFSVNLLDIL